MKFLRTLLILGRVSNLPTVWTNVVVGWLVGGGFFGWEIGWLIAGVSLLYWAGMTLNDAFDAGWDRENAPERPIPSGAISLSATWIIGIGQMLAGIALLMWKANPGIGVLAGLVAAILAYDWIHKKWKGSVLLMGLCRTLVYLLAWEAARADMQLSPISPLIYLLGIGVLLYIAALTMVARSERGKPDTALSTLPRLMLLIPTAFPVMVLYCERSLDISQLLLFTGIIASSIWIVYTRSLLAAGKIPAGIGAAIAGIALYDTTVAVLLDWRAGLFCLGCFAVTLIAQRFIPAT
ncbi:MAG: UbiA family prenyltransferase [Verrucomicrobiales bacterium]|nr:UbiA family prenyltransferase [Verrucomicrobiales bacterium]